MQPSHVQAPSSPKPTAAPAATVAERKAPAALDDITALSRCADIIDRVPTVEERQRVVRYLSTKYLPPAP